ncbi:hypothetical protein ACIHFD_49380 [Nonomuraea sp. NPDC051941]|uniref:hypothetical protein n=1 Tax=Nonomuraea sp. NPDC051941 TaxID=3364373 RepID=UPI0037CB6DDA
MLNTTITDLEKRRLRLAAALEVANRDSSYAGERDTAHMLAARLRTRIYQIERDLPTGAGHVVIPARAGFGKVRLELTCDLILRLGGWVSVLARQVTFKHGDAVLTWTARADRVARIEALVPEFLDDIDTAALEAARGHRAYLRSLPETDHDPAWRDSLVRSYRRDFLRHYGAALIHHIVTGKRTEAAGTVRGRSAFHDALTAAATADTTRYQLDGSRRVIALPAAPHHRRSA